MFLYFDKKNIVKVATTRPINTNVYNIIEVKELPLDPIGKRIIFGDNNWGKKKLRVAVICNWDDDCGIATYTKYLIKALTPKVDDIKIFSEKTPLVKLDGPYKVSYSWNRGESMRGAIEEVLDWNPTVILIQHEYGIFPKTSYFLQMLQDIEDTPYVVTLHSVYEHLDKTIASSVMKNIIVHTDEGQACLKRLGNGNRIWVIPHGCVQFEDKEELWNTWQTPYAIMQFGFGFAYKGVENVLRTVALLKERHGDKYKDIFYTYFCSENKHVKNINDYYSSKIKQEIKKLGIQDNAVVVRGYQNEHILNNCIRTSRLAVFPYITDYDNIVYGASGAIRIAMANGIPVIASSSHMFDDMEGIVPRPKNVEELAVEIDRIFSNANYKQGILDRAAAYIDENSWEKTAERYLSVLREVSAEDSENVIFV